MEKLDICIHFLLSKALQSVNQVSKSKLSPFGVTPVQYALLCLLWKKDGQLGYELGEKLLLDSATITGIIDRLEQNGFIERRVDLNDRRNKIIFLTEKGSLVEASLCQKMDEMNEEIMADFNEEDFRQFKKMLFDIGISKKNKRV